MNNQKASTKRLTGRGTTALVCAVLTLLVLLVFAQVGNFDFVNLDDDLHVYENPRVHTGLTAANVAWAFGVHGPGQWHPLAYLSHQWVYECFGAGPRAHHLLNLAFHAASVLILLLALRGMTGRLWPSAFVAAMFGLHPLSVESVAWVCERRDVMCGLFWMLTLWAYTGYARRGGTPRYIMVALCCALALMSKPMAVTLPCALLLLDVWPLRRTPFRTVPTNNDIIGTLPACPPRSVRFLVLEKLPLLGLSVISSILSILSHRDAVISLDAVPLHLRVANGLVAYTVYLRKMLWPVDLCAWYPHPASQPSFQLSSLIWAALAAALLLLAITALCIRHMRRRPYLALGWFWYLGILFPVSGLFQTGFHAYADRFTYIPLIGIYIAIAWGTADLISRWHVGQVVLKIATPVLLVACITATSVQVATWRDSRSLFQQALRHTKENTLAHNSLGNALLALRFPDEAIVHYREALRIEPNNADPHTNWGNALQALGNTQEAIDQYREALRIKPDDAKAHYNLGLALQKRDRLKDAMTHFQEALRIKPLYADAENSLGLAIKESGRPHEAIAHYERALRIRPDFADAHNNWGNALQELARPAEAADHYQQVLRLDPNHADAHNNLGLAMHALGRHQEAIRHYQETLRIKPDHAEAHYNWGLVSYNSDHFQDAIEHYRKALQLNPDHVEAHNNLGIIYAGMGKLEDAQEHFEQAIRLNPDFKPTQDNLRRARELLQEQAGPREQ